MLHFNILMLHVDMDKSYVNVIISHVDILLPPTCKIIYVDMQHNFAHMRLIYVNMQDNNVDMQLGLSCMLT